ncbi:MAG: AMP-binding protein [Saprospiraceae bacterium]|nr:AMP-binding protein [Saprospiraceae bacterium]MBK7738008.1 AMP-binding protein [Saprospiraceae bacterium]MBK7913413.1 AMP-binding protein [Saprospiraceae bacterium]
MSDLRPWLKNYPAGIPANVKTDLYPSLREFAAECLSKFAPLKAFTIMGQSMTYKELDDKSNAFAAYLHYRGLKPGDRIALMMPNLFQYPIAILGAIRAGLVIVNTNPLYTPREMEFVFVNSKVKAIVIVENFASNLEKILAKTQIEIIITTTIGELMKGLKGSIIDFTVKYIKRMVPRFKLNNTVNFSTALRQGARQTIKAFSVKPDDIAILQYTGGTTGVSKGAMLTHHNLLSNIEQIRAVICYYLKEGKETTLSPLPMYHIFAFAVNLMAMMTIGANTVLILNARDLGSIIKAFRQHPISLMTGVNTLYNALMNHPDFSKINFSSLKVTVAGGMALQSSVAERWKSLTGCGLSEGYGMTEASPVVSLNPIDGNGKPGSIGLPVPSTDVRIVDESGRVCGFGEIGEIQVRGPQVMLGYLDRPDETAKTIVDGWLCTGDIGSMDSDGYFRIVDRKKDMIIVSGFNVFPAEIEEVLSRHPKILEVAAIGIPDDKSGEVVKVFIVKRDKSLDEEEVEQYCRENFTNYKLPKAIEFRDTLPKTNIGKVLRRELRS